jgi:hypothetical protein
MDFGSEGDADDIYVLYLSCTIIIITVVHSIRVSVEPAVAPDLLSLAIWKTRFYINGMP